MSVRGFFKEAAKFAGAGLQSGVRTGMKTYETVKKIEAEEKRLGFEEARVKHEKDRLLLEGRRVKEFEEAGKSTRETEAIQRDILRLEKEIKQYEANVAKGLSQAKLDEAKERVLNLRSQITYRLQQTTERELDRMHQAGMSETDHKRALLMLQFQTYYAQQLEGYKAELDVIRERKKAGYAERKHQITLDPEAKLPALEKGKELSAVETMAKPLSTDIPEGEIHTGKTPIEVQDTKGTTSEDLPPDSVAGGTQPPEVSLSVSPMDQSILDLTRHADSQIGGNDSATAKVLLKAASPDELREILQLAGDSTKTEVIEVDGESYELTPSVKNMLLQMMGQPGQWTPPTRGTMPTWEPPTGRNIPPWTRPTPQQMQNFERWGEDQRGALKSDPTWSGRQKTRFQRRWASNR